MASAFAALATGLLSVALIRGSAQAAAPTPQTPKLEGSGCAESLLESAAAQLRIELANQAPPAAALRIRVTCWSSAVEVAVLSERQQRELIRQRVELAATRQHLRPRIVALTIAELLREARVPGFDRNPAQRKIGAKVAAPRAEPEPVVSPRPVVRLLAFAQTSSFRFETPPAWGGGLRLDYAAARFAFGLDSTVALGIEARSLGTVSVTTLGLSPYAAWAPRSRPWFGRLGLGHTVGIARISGEARAADARSEVVTGVWAAPYVLAGLGVELHPIAVELRGQLGWVTVPVEGLVEEGRTVGLSGAWSALQLGAGVAF